MPKGTPMATTTTSAMPPIIAGPIANTAWTETEAPSSITATSSSSLADRSISGRSAAGGFQAVRRATPTRIASTSAST